MAVILASVLLSIQALAGEGLGVYRAGLFYLRNTPTTGVADTAFEFGPPAGVVAVAGDWNADGRDTIGYWWRGIFFLRNANSGGIPDMAFTYGLPSDQPVVGDWDGDGRTTVGVVRDGLFIFRNTPGGGFGEGELAVGSAPYYVVGDFDGDGRDEVRASGVLAVAGDFDGDGRDDLVRVANGIWQIGTRLIYYGEPGDVPLAGRWVREEPDPCVSSSPMALSIKERFGARGDGVTNDYWALAAAAEFFSRPEAQGMRLVFPEGVYRIGVHAVNDGAGWVDSVEGRAIPDNRITWRNSRSITIQGCGAARVEVAGDFYAGRDAAGIERLQITPFNFEYTDGVTVRNLEIDGNNEQTFRDPQGYTCGGYGLMVRASSGLRLEGLDVHNMTCDGLTLGYWTWKGDGVVTDTLVTASRFHSNSRHGMSIIHAVGATFLRSEFISNGWNQPGYAGLATMSGVDIEPEDYSPETPVTDRIYFRNSRLEGNRSLDLRIWPYMEHEPPPRIGNIYLLDGSFVRYYFVAPFGGGRLHFTE